MNETKKQIELLLTEKQKSKTWLAKKMGMTLKLFSAKLNGNQKRYSPFTDVEVNKMKKILS
jgi:hypothetical protein